MSAAEIAAPERRGWQRAVAATALALLRASLAISPRPLALVLRREFAKSGASRAERLRPTVPAAAVVARDERYASGRDCVLDVYVPRDAAGTGDRLPVLLWVHGGAFVGGSKDEIDYYFHALAATGLCVVAIGYSLAPESTYPTPVRQAMAALGHVQEHAERLHADTARIALAGDSAGSHISAQVAAAITNREYATTIGVSPAVGPEQLRAVVLCCGVYDFATAANDPKMRGFMLACGWAYSGIKDFLEDPSFIPSTDVGRHIAPGFPPAFLTVGNVDPLRSQTEQLIGSLEAAGVPTETLLYPTDHQPPLSHEYQFDLGLQDGRIALERIAAFVHRETA